jgi:hypothetical protein
MNSHYLSEFLMCLITIVPGYPADLEECLGSWSIYSDDFVNTQIIQRLQVTHELTVNSFRAALCISTAYPSSIMELLSNCSK